MPKKVDILEGLHVIRWVLIDFFYDIDTEISILKKIFICICMSILISFVILVWLFFFLFFFGCSVACGYGHSLVIVDRTNVGERLDQVILWDSLSVLYHKHLFTLYLIVPKPRTKFARRFCYMLAFLSIMEVLKVVYPM